MDLSFSPSPSEISELKSSMRNMDKYKYVLNHKIHLLQEEIQPKVCANVLSGDIFTLIYSTLLYLPPLRFNCVGGCLDPGLLQL
jgi:hypothetical protein